MPRTERMRRGSYSCRLTEAASRLASWPSPLPPAPTPYFALAALGPQHTSWRDPAEQESAVCCFSAPSSATTAASLGMKTNSRTKPPLPFWLHLPPGILFFSVQLCPLLPLRTHFLQPSLSSTLLQPH